MTHFPNPQLASLWPSPRCAFQIEWDSVQFGCEEVMGLVTILTTTEHRWGNNTYKVLDRMQEDRNHKNVVLKRPENRGYASIFEWLDLKGFELPPVYDATIKLLDCDTKITRKVWTLTKAWPVKVHVIGPDEGYVIDSFELAYDALVTESHL